MTEADTLASCKYKVFTMSSWTFAAAASMLLLLLASIYFNVLCSGNHGIRCFYPRNPIEMLIIFLFQFEITPGVLTFPLCLHVIGNKEKVWRQPPSNDATMPWNRQARKIPFRVFLVALMMNSALGFLHMSVFPPAAIRYIGNHKAVNYQLSSQMVALQIAVDKFASLHNGKYPIKLDAEVAACFPKEDSQFYGGNISTFSNVVSHGKNWLLVFSAFSEEEAIKLASGANDGQVIYCFLKDYPHDNYWIMGKDDFGQLRRNARGEAFVLTKQIQH